MKSEDFNRQMGHILRKFRETSRTLTVLKRQRKFLEEDLDDEIKWRRTTAPNDSGLVDRVYADTIVTRVMNASTKMTSQPFDSKTFKKAVIELYNLEEKNNLQLKSIS